MKSAPPCLVSLRRAGKQEDVEMGKPITVLSAGLLMFSGCSSVGPDGVQQDRFTYNKSVQQCWKEQTLLNIVRLCYADLPVFLQVASIVRGYTLEGSVNVMGSV